MLSAIQIQRHVFSRVDIQTLHVDPGQVETEDYASKIGVSEITHRPEDDLWHISLDVQFGPGETQTPVRYRGHLTVHGSFKIHPEFPEDKREAFIRMNGASLLLGSVREMVMLITSRSIAGELVLATFDARSFLEEPETPGGQI